MIKKHRFWVWLVVLTLVVTLVAACGQEPTDTEDEPGETPAPTTGEEQPEEPDQVITVAQTYDWDTLDPTTFTSITSSQLSYNIYSRLVGYEIGGTELVPQLATDWQVSDDGTQWTFILRDDAVFHKGYGPVTAEDVVFSFDRLVDPESPSYDDYKFIVDVEAVDEHTVQFTLDTPHSDFLYLVAGTATSIWSKKAFDELGAEEYGQNPVGSGPFVFDEWIPSQQTVVVKNEEYFEEGLPKLDKVIFKPIPEASTMFAAFENGDVNIIQVTDPDRLAQYESNPEFTLKKRPATNVRFIGYNHNIEPFDDKRVRQALWYGFNVKGVLENVLPGLSDPATGPTSSMTYGYTTDVPRYDYNPEKAKELLAEAGYPDGFDVTFSLPNIDRFIIPAQVFENNMQDLGVNVELNVMETATYLQKYRESEFPLFSHSRGHTPFPARLLYVWFHPEANPPEGYSNPDVTGWIDELFVATDDERAKELFANVQKQVVEDAVHIFIDYEYNIYAMQNKVKGYESDPMRTLRLKTTFVATE